MWRPLVCSLHLLVYSCFTSHATIFQSYMWRHRCAGGLKKKLYLRSGSQRHRHFVWFFKVPVHQHWTTLFTRWFRHTAPFSRLLRHAGDTEDVFSTYTPGVLTASVAETVQSVSCLQCFTTMSSVWPWLLTLTLKINRCRALAIRSVCTKFDGPSWNGSVCIVFTSWQTQRQTDGWTPRQTPAPYHNTPRQVVRIKR